MRAILLFFENSFHKTAYIRTIFACPAYPPSISCSLRSALSPLSYLLLSRRISFRLFMLSQRIFHLYIGRKYYITRMAADERSGASSIISPFLILPYLFPCHGIPPSKHPYYCISGCFRPINEAPAVFQAGTP